MDTELLVLILPLAILQVGLQIFALYDLYQRKTVRTLSVLVWIFIIVLLTIPGPVAYFVFGRSDHELYEEPL